MPKVLGIDLGTTNSAMAIINDYGRPEILVNREGERVTPSVVLFDDDLPTVGTVAKNTAVARPLDIVQFVKRQVGNPDWTFRTASGAAFTPEEISAFILKRLKEDAEATLGEPITQAVISVPAYFDDAKRKATQDAGKIANLEILRILNEPTAAALAYGIDSAEPSTFLIYDLGGGTFDVTAMKAEAHELTVIATGGDPNLGGFDWDNLVMTWLNEQFMAKGGPDLFADVHTEQELRDKSEIAKRTLSTRDQTNVFLSARGFDEKITLTRATFDEISDSLISRTGHLTEQVLEDAQLAWADISKVLLVGGSSRMRQVSDLLSRISGHQPSLELNPDEVVAVGAAIQGALLSDAPGAPEIVTASGQRIGAMKIQDVTAHSLGLVVVNLPGQRTNDIVLARGSTIPARASDVLVTLVDRQLQYHCEVTEGEDVDLDYVRIVGEGMITLPGTYPAGSRMEVAFEYDADGIIHVHVTDLVANTLLGELDIERNANLSDADVQQMREATSGTAVE